MLLIGDTFVGAYFNTFYTTCCGRKTIKAWMLI